MKGMLQRIMNPRRRFAPANEADVRLLPGGAKMLQISDRAEATTSVPSKPDQLSMVGLANQVDHAIKLRMVMLFGTDLHPLNPTECVRHDLLEIFDRPCFGRVVALDTRVHEPKRNLATVGLVMADLVHPVFLVVAQVQAGTNHLERQWSAKFGSKIFRVSSQKRDVFLVAAVDRRIL